MKYLILGGSGLIGSHLAKLLCEDNEVAITYYANSIRMKNCVTHKIDLMKADDVEEIITKSLPDVVIHAAPTSNVDWHETHQAEAYQLNVATTKIIAERCRATCAKLVYISTAFVFPDSHIFAEDDIPAPINFYGATKLGGELATSINPNHLIIRTDQIFGWTLGKKKSFVENVLASLALGKEIEVCEDWYNCPTYADDLANSILRLIKKNNSGTYHVTGDDYVNRVQWANAVAKVFDKDSSLIRPIHSSILKLPAKRPNARLSNTRVKKELAIQFGGIEDRVRAMSEILHS